MKNIVVLVRNASWFSLGIACAAILLFGVAATEAASTINTNLATDGTLSVTGASTLTGAVTAAAAVSVGTDLTVTDDATISDDLTVSGTASSTDLKVGDDQVSTIAGLIHGFCTFTDVTSFTAPTPPKFFSPRPRRGGLAPPPRPHCIKFFAPPTHNFPPGRAAPGFLPAPGVKFFGG